MPGSDQLNDLLSQVGPGKGTGKYLEQLRPESLEVLEQFEQWLKTEDPNGLKAESTARAYKGYVAKAIVELEKDPEFELDSDVKSAIGALRRFKMATAGQPPSSLDEEPEDDAVEEPTGDEDWTEPVQVPGE